MPRTQAGRSMFHAMAERPGEYFTISKTAAGEWWRQNSPAGAVLSRLLFLFVAAPIALVFNDYYVLSFVVFALMVPYGLLLRQLAVRAVKSHLERHPEALGPFREDGIVSGGDADDDGRLVRNS